MAKVRFYADVPVWKVPNYTIMASTGSGTAPPSWCKRVAFDVDMPPDVLREQDAHGIVTAVAVVDEGEKRG